MISNSTFLSPGIGLKLTADSNTKQKLVPLVMSTLLVITHATSAFALEDPQTAESLWSSPNLKRIQENYTGPKISKDQAGETKILISFILHPDGHIAKVKSVKRTGNSKAKCDISRKQFKKVEAALVKAIKASEPLYYRKQPNDKTSPWGVVYVYQPKKYPLGRMIRVAISPFDDMGHQN